MADSSLIWQLIGLLNRPNSATLGAAAEFVKGTRGEPSSMAEGFGRGLLTGETGGQDVVAALAGKKVEDLSNPQRFLGLAGDFVNPLDPLNYVGIGALTKSGRAAKALGRLPGIAEDLRLAPKLSEQIARGQRGLVTFGGHSLPVGSGIVKLAEDIAGKAPNAPGIGKVVRGLEQAFGGRKGAVVGAFADPEQRRIANLVYDMTQDIGVPIRGFEDAVKDDFAKLDRLHPEEGKLMGDLISKTVRQDISMDEAYQQFIGSAGNEARRKIRMEAWQSAKSVAPKLKEFSGLLDGSGLDMYLGPELGFLPRMIKPLGGDISGAATERELDRIFGRNNLGKITMLGGQSHNPVNKALVQRSIQGVSPEFIDTAGKQKLAGWTYISDEGKELNGIDAFNAEMTNKPGAFKKFLESHRMDLESLDNALQDQNIGTVERNAVRLLKELQRQVAENVRTDLLVQDLHAQGIAVPWVDDLHKVESLRDAKFVKIDQGRFSDRPLALPKEWSDAVDRVLNVMSPHPNIPILGMQMRDWLPKPVADFGLLSALKLSLIYGVIPNPLAGITEKKVRALPVSAMSYWSRNMATGVFNNLIEGLGPHALSPGSMSGTMRHYSTAFELTKEWSRGEFGKGVVKLGPVAIDKQRLRQMYMGMNMHGGGVPELDVMGDITNETKLGQAIARWRKELFYNTTDFEFKGWRMNLQAGQDASEYMVRVPLMLHTLEETFKAAEKNGIKLPAHIKALTGEGEIALLSHHKRSMSAYKYGKETGIENINYNPALPAPVIEDNAGITWAAFENAREAVIRAHFDYTDLSPLEQRIRASWIPFYTWMRKNIPRQSVKMFTDFGRYMPFARSYYRAFINQGIDPEDLPPWMSETYAIPVAKPDGRIRVIDMTNFLPFVDVFELGEAMFGRPRYGGTNTNDMLRWMMQQANPLYMLPAEIAMQTDTFGRRFEGDMPVEYMGLPGMSQNMKQGVDLARGFGDIDRLNPGGVFTKLGELTGTIRPDDKGRRPNRNEAPEAYRWLRQFTGFTMRETDKNNFDKSITQRKAHAATLRRQRVAAIQQGDLQLARTKQRELEQYQRGGGR